MADISLTYRGRGAGNNPANRFLPLAVERDEWTLEHDPGPGTVLLEDTTRSILASNDSPDVNFDVSLNPYRGCEHGCAYCYARPTHEYLGFSAGLDFETKLLVNVTRPSCCGPPSENHRGGPARSPSAE